MSSSSRLDRVYRNILQTKFFTKGWGNTENLKRLFEFRKVVSRRESCFNLVPPDYPVSVFKDETVGDYRILEGKFLSPFVKHLPNILPKEAETAYFQAVLPAEWQSKQYRPVCIHLAGTGDHGYWRRRQIMAKPLIKESGIGAVLLENPFYGLRKPKDQVRSSLHNVSDIFVMGGCLILESLAILHWCEKSGFGPLGLTGISMGGHMASLAATNWPKPIVLVPCLSWSTASSVFTEGVMSESINWDLLASQYFSDDTYREEIRKMVTVKEDAFRAGQHFAKHYPQSLDRVNELRRESQITDAGDNSKEVNSSEPVKTRAGSLNVTLMCKDKGVFTFQKQNGNSGASSNQNSSLNVSTPSVNKQETVNVGEVSHVQNNIQECCRTVSGNINKLDNGIPYTHSVVSKLSSNILSVNIVNQNLPTTKIKELLRDLKLLESWRKNNEDQKKKGSTQHLKKKREYEVLQFMRGIMDECTHLQNFDVPVDTSLIIAICARNDAYVPRDSCTHLSEIWPGAEIRYIDAGHVTAYVLHQRIFRAAIAESFERLRKKYYL
ncbi:protein ABHD18 isoform X2 [Schistocerca gregaria]|uniref:protein ABHD18 isoform X2 n=1 Tax=Schistocerca gregaria TaxID=7010 RepID=UPI00211E3DCD|nr:protein ABHD18 isoform X2 [Schistocerca gregaria]